MSADTRTPGTTRPDIQAEPRSQRVIDFLTLGNGQSISVTDKILNNPPRHDNPVGRYLLYVDKTQNDPDTESQTFVGREHLTEGDLIGARDALVERIFDSRTSDTDKTSDRVILTHVVKLQSIGDHAVRYIS
ncbi:MAG: hypothetical protein ACD_37C00329G0002 [uncultured bacterium]|nr:MAG: hypothetical protein ACD_37C00329G0002 [uncultured bacterium]